MWGEAGRNIRDNLFIINGIIRNVVNGKAKQVDVTLCDISKCFDEMWYQETFNDHYDVKVQDENLHC